MSSELPRLDCFIGKICRLNWSDYLEGFIENQLFININ